MRSFDAVEVAALVIGSNGIQLATLGWIADTDVMWRSGIVLGVVALATISIAGHMAGRSGDGLERKIGEVGAEVRRLR